MCTGSESPPLQPPLMLPPSSSSSASACANATLDATPTTPTRSTAGAKVASLIQLGLARVEKRSFRLSSNNAAATAAAAAAAAAAASSDAFDQSLSAALLDATPVRRKSSHRHSKSKKAKQKENKKRDFKACFLLQTLRSFVYDFFFLRS